MKNRKCNCRRPSTKKELAEQKAWEKKIEEQEREEIRIRREDIKDLKKNPPKDASPLVLEYIKNLKLPYYRK